MRKEKIIAGQIYHVLNRGANKQPIFYNNEDYARFVHDLYEFNDSNPISNSLYRFKSKYMVTRSPYIDGGNYNGKGRRIQRENIVSLLAFVLMKNHYHLLIIPKTDKSLQKFMHRLNMGFSRYMREKYERSGTLFEGPYKAILVKKESHFIHLPFYIHLNPLDYFMAKWREHEITDYKKAMDYLENYKWSSFQDYIGKKNFSSVTQREFLMNFFNGPKEYKKSILEWLKSRDPSDIKEIALE